MSTAKIRYVGLKQEETAFKDVTGITWVPDAVESVDLKHVAAMLRHPDVFALAEESIGGLADAKPAPSAPVTLTPAAMQLSDKDAPIVQSNLSPSDVAALANSVALDTLTREELHALAKARGVKVHHSSGAAAVTAALLAVVDTPAAG